MHLKDIDLGLVYEPTRIMIANERPEARMLTHDVASMCDCSVEGGCVSMETKERSSCTDLYILYRPWSVGTMIARACRCSSEA
jgi:hypothetical protein